jgi:predicted dehydrogenase
VVFEGHSINRRQFLATLPVLVAPVIVGCHSQRQKLRIAAIGAGDKGQTDIECCDGEEIVAICDVDETMAAAMRKTHPRAKFYFDWRVLLEREAGNIDAVIVSTPDHLHAVVASHAIKAGKHVYCQKPLAQTLHETAYLTQLASKHRVVTQMGNQGSAEDSFRRAVEVLQAGVIGKITQIYAWSDRPIWPQGIHRPLRIEPVPANLRWDNWLGPASWRPFCTGAYHPFKWRGWYDFGTGALGDMGCHLLNLPYRAAQLSLPITVEASNEINPNGDTYPSASRVRFEFPARQGMPPAQLFWFDGGSKVGTAGLNLPQAAQFAIKDLLGALPASGCLMLGDKGMALSPDDYGAKFFLKLNDEDQFVKGFSHPAVRSIPQTLPRLRGRAYADLKHHREWISACQGGPKPFSDFETIANLTQIVLLGCLAARINARIEYDPQNSRIIGPPAALQYVSREYRKGWELA